MSGPNNDTGYGRVLPSKDVQNSSWLERKTGRFTIPIIVALIFIVTLICFVYLIIHLGEDLSEAVYSIFSGLLGLMVGFLVGKKNPKGIKF